MSVRRRDPDQQAVYYAERVTFDGTLHNEPLHSTDFMTLADRLFAHDWWERHNVPVPLVEPTSGKDTTSYALAHIEDVSRDPVIRIAPHDINARVLAHEAAHIAQYHWYKWNTYGPIEAHGREFRATYLRVAEIVLGTDAADALRGNFERFVTLRPEHAPGMPGSIMTVPRPKPELDPTGMGLYPTWRLAEQVAEMARLQPVASVPRLNGAIAL